jgi:hypothetical protein
MAYQLRALISEQKYLPHVSRPLNASELAALVDADRDRRDGERCLIGRHEFGGADDSRKRNPGESPATEVVKPGKALDVFEMHWIPPARRRGTRSPPPSPNTTPRTAFRSLTGGTPAKRRAILERFREKHGHMPLSSLPKEFVVALLDTMKPTVASNWLTALRHFFQWCEQRKLLRADPTWGIRFKLPKSGGHHTWTEDEIAAFEAHHAVGSKARLVLALGLYTAQRRGDVTRIGRQHIRDGVLTVRPQKTMHTTAVTLAIPVHPELQKIIAATPVGHLTLLTTKTGRTYGATVFSENFVPGAMPPTSRGIASSMACAKRLHVGSRKRDAQRTRSQH